MRSDQFISLHYIRYAIYDRLGVWLSLPQVCDYLVSEGLLTKTQADDLYVSSDFIFDLEQG